MQRSYTPNQISLIRVGGYLKSTGNLLLSLRQASLILFATLLLLHNLSYHPLNGDEAFTILNWSTPDLHYLLTNLGVIDPQPAIAILTFNIWMKLSGISEFATRLPSVLATLLTISAIQVILKLLHTPRPIHSTILITLIVHPLLLWHAQDLRPYASWIALSTVSIAIYLKMLTQPTTSIWFTLYILTTMLACGIYYLHIFIWLITIIATFLLIPFKKATFPSFINTQIAIALLIIPWYLQPHLINSNYHPTATYPDFSKALIELIFNTTTPLLVNNLWQIIVVILIILLSLFSLAASHHSRSSRIFLWLLAFGPLIVLALLTFFTQKGFFRARYIVPSIPFLMITVIIGTHLTIIRLIKSHTITFLLTTILIIAPLLISQVHYRYDPTYRKAPDWRAITLFLEQQTTSHDLIILNYPDPSFTYYYKGAAPAITLPSEFAQSNSSLTNKLKAIPDVPHIWFLPVNSPIWDPKHTVSTWLDEHYQPISQHSIANTKILQYANWLPTNPHLQFIGIHIPIADTVLLYGYKITPKQTTFQPGTTIFLELFWLPLHKTLTPMTIFVHLIDEYSLSPVAQEDSPPQDGKTTTTTWKPTYPIRDVYTLSIPPDAPPGIYTIYTGMYDPTTGDRLPTNTPNNSIPITTIIIAFAP